MDVVIDDVREIHQILRKKLTKDFEGKFGENEEGVSFWKDDTCNAPQ